ncbi:MAG: ABC transporter permease [Salinivirgaceae bacterium]|nr:ABC transporter permease [Salinivirgaceae bacterium]
MSKISKIIQREYITRVRKKSFIIMTILGPILFAALMVAPMLMSKFDDGTERKVAVVDSSSIFDYTKILKEVTLINTHQLQKDIKTLNAKAGQHNDEFKVLADRLHSIVNQRDEKLVENIQISLKSFISTLQKKSILTENQADSIYERHAAYYDLLIKQFESIRGKIPDDASTKFVYVDMSFEQTKQTLNDEIYHAVVFIPKNILSSQQIQVYSKKAVSMSLRSHIRTNIERAVENQKMVEVGISLEDMSRIKTKINTQTIRVTEEGDTKESRPEIAMFIGYISGFLIYFAIFMFGSLVMRGVIEEKSNRIVEVILSSVKPFQLLMGKIVGVGLVGLSQFLLWIVLTFALVQLAGTLLMPTNVDVMQQQAQEMLGSGSMQSIEPVIDDASFDMSIVFESLEAVNFPLIIGMFLFFFVGGFLLYGALFAAVGSAVDNEADTQQFMIPITIPLIIALVAMLNVMQNPESQLAYWLSIIPFTSPVVMMVRLPYGVPVFEIITSVVLLIGAFVFTTWLAAKIYKTGVLMYGSKVNWKDLWKWIRHS